ncbi:MAG: carboxylesterase/lipase family protein, partial [Spirochaetia bacterium]|nr:carboxylesterase/lipase family protein [Spirochaetia bacterium]
MRKFLHVSVPKIFLLTLLVLAGCTSGRGTVTPEKAVVSTESGKIRGTLTQSGVYQFLGVPYAEAKERFVPAVPADKWDGEFDATEYGDTSPQFAILGIGENNAGDGTSNNCTNLNIWTPATDGGKRSVMVWLHGGGFSAGSANLPDYDGENLARTQDVVVVGVNHRLNVFGHLDLSDFGGKYRYSANVGMMDIVQALEWIKANIASFGGNPDNVTIFGESGGGAKVLAMMTSPYAKGLFHKAINESGATENMGVEFQRSDYSRELGKLIVAKLGLTAETIDQIQNVDAVHLMDISSEAQSETAQKFRLPISVGEGYAMEWEPVVDGDFIPTHPVLETGFAEAGENIPLLIGSNLNEWTMRMPVTSHPDMSDEARAEYQKAYPNEDKATAPFVDTLLRLPLLKITMHKADQNGADVYSYIFTKQIDEQSGSFHTAEIPFVFANTTDPLSAVMSEAWANFAKTGVPSAKGLPAWEPYTRESGATMILDDKSYLT